ILHTADWHIGQLFHAYDRTFEHQQFLKWLVDTISSEAVDVLLISGDVFDLSNPSAASVRMFYTFLNGATKANPDLQIIVTAGNHDSPSRLEAPKPLLESSNIHIIGLVERDANGALDYDKLVIPLTGDSGKVEALCLAVPFLRTGEYPTIAECSDPYAEGVAAMYSAVYAAAVARQQEGQAIIAMGHLTAAGSERTSDDEDERPIMGGVECIAADALPAGLSYVALGHIHKAQKVGGKDHIRYCGSPIPMSFTEANYKHQILSFELQNGALTSLKAIEIPIAVSLKRVPGTHQPLYAVLAELGSLPDEQPLTKLAPYLEVRVLLDAPEPGLRHKIETALQGKHYRLAKIDAKHPVQTDDPTTELISGRKLTDIKPAEVFQSMYQAKYQAPPPEILVKLFNEVSTEISQREAL
ncbi:MAG TPA: exonuclease SbcCD subunit D C-terminal domain-containing protein, partial [Puia sp.]|nr:exonuclease SbcCD subunit D C-terminal domain-containing protein [Puia sp.]